LGIGSFFSRGHLNRNVTRAMMEQPSTVSPSFPRMSQASNEQATKSIVDFDRIRSAVSPVLAAHRVTLVDLEWVTEHSAWTLRFTIESNEAAASMSSDPAGGVSLEDCADVSRDISTALDEVDVVTHAYSLEVSSPGLDRKIRSSGDFRRFRGKSARVKLARPAPDGQRLLRGELLEAPENNIAVLVDGKRIEAPLDDVVEARLVYELEPKPKKTKGSGTSKTQRAKPSGQNR
jgi:ribosome maturation factor RimP